MHFVPRIFLATAMLATLAFASLTFSSFSQAQQAKELGKPYVEFGKYKAFFSVFNSSFIPPEVAQAYKLVRAKDRALVNIAILKGNATAGSAATVSGTFTNLLQQTKTLEFNQIKEQNATYYLAPLRFTSEDILRFDITVQPEGSEAPHSFSFSRKMQKD